MHNVIFFMSLFLAGNSLFADIVKTQNPVSISTQSLKDFANNPKPVKDLINMALKLTSQHLGYLYGSADPVNRGMDCSGTIYYLLGKAGVREVPRSSDLIFQWVKEKGHLYTVSDHSLSSSDFSHLRPGDLLFWSGTYAIKREINITHVMLYLGKNTAGEPLMVGASNGRTYKGKKIYGVSVFDFQLPDVHSKSKFSGYSCTPHINCSA